MIGEAYLISVWLAVVGSSPLQTSIHSRPDDDCLDLDLLVAALEVVEEHWLTWTKTSLAGSWPGSLEPVDCTSDWNECRIFNHIRGGRAGAGDCGETFYWAEDDEGAVLDSVRLYFTIESQQDARRAVALLEEAVSPPPGALRFSEIRDGDSVAGGLHWETREQNRVTRVAIVEWVVEPDADAWLVRFGYGREDQRSDGWGSKPCGRVVCRRFVAHAGTERGASPVRRVCQVFCVNDHRFSSGLGLRKRS